MSRKSVSLSTCSALSSYYSRDCLSPSRAVSTTASSKLILTSGSRPAASSCSAATAHSCRSSASWKLKPFWARCPVTVNGDGTLLINSDQGDVRPGTNHPSRSTIALYRPRTTNSHVKLRCQPLRLESYWK